MARSPLFRQSVRILQQAHREHLFQGKPPLAKESVREPRQRSNGDPLAARAAIAKSQHAPRIAIVGGELAGLNAAYQLKKAGLTATVYALSKLLEQLRSPKHSKPPEPLRLRTLFKQWSLSPCLNNSQRTVFAPQLSEGLPSPLPIYTDSLVAIQYFSIRA